MNLEKSEEPNQIFNQMTEQHSPDWKGPQKGPHLVQTFM